MTEDSFVGEHTPQVDLDGGGRGIAQAGLAVVANKGYLGYVVLAGDPSAAPIEVSLKWGSGANDLQTASIEKISHEFEKYPIQFKAGASNDDAIRAVKLMSARVADEALEGLALRGYEEKGEQAAEPQATDAASQGEVVAAGSEEPAG